MAVVVEQSTPFSPAVLDLQNESRWNNLLPLIRPTIKAVPTSKGSNILIDEALVTESFVHIAAVGTLGHFSSKLLDDKHVTAIATEPNSARQLEVEDIVTAMQSAGVAKELGIAMVKRGTERKVYGSGQNVVVVETESDVDQNHVLHLLGTAPSLCRSSIQHVTELLTQYVNAVSTSHSKFHTEMVNGQPAVLHDDGVKGFDQATDAVERDLQRMMRTHGNEKADVVYSVHYADANGLSRLEIYIMAGIIAKYFESQRRPYRLSQSTVVDYSDATRGYSISICPISTQYLVAQRTPQAHERAQSLEVTQPLVVSPSTCKMSFDDTAVRRCIESGCKAVIKEEPTITGYDTIVGDGDCGYTLRDGAKQVLSFIEGKDLSCLPETVASLVHELEVNMGGTSGALYCIFLTALAGALATEDSIAQALKVALQQLLKYTRARLGDRTMMDALIPFVDTFETTGNVDQAIAEAKRGVEGTRKMEAKLGRSTYLDESATRGVPDPGAFGLLVLLQGMATT